MEPVFPLKMPVHRQLHSHRVVYRLLLASNFVDQNLVQPLKVITASQRTTQLSTKFSSS